MKCLYNHIKTNRFLKMLYPHSNDRKNSFILKSGTVKIRILILFLVFMGGKAFASHNRAGEITYMQVGGPKSLTFQATLITYTDTRSPKADRPNITLDWGDGQSSSINRQSQITLPNFVWKNTYISTHVYSGPGSYVISFQDPNRVADVLNMDQSFYTPFYVESLLIIDPLQGFVQSPILLNPPIQNACAFHKFTDNPDAYDADGDSLYFKLIPPKQAVGTNVSGYFTPQHLKLDSTNGEVTWDSATQIGIYNIAIQVQMYRNKKLIGYIIRDMQIIVIDCSVLYPPFIEPLPDTCIEAGINFNYKLPVVARDTDKGYMHYDSIILKYYDSIKLTASGGPFLQSSSPAVMHNNPIIGKDSVKAVFEWAVSCESIREQPYIVIFKAIDQDSIADIKSMKIRVVGPEPQQLTATPAGNSVILNWKLPKCPNPVGYFIYRRGDSSTWQHSNCETGVPGYVGYRRIDTITNPNTFTFIDNNHGDDLAPGIKYCYLVTAIYLNDGQFQYVEGYASNEACAELKKDVPVLTHASVRVTNTSHGSMYVDWSKPLASALDTNQNPAPYKYELYRSPGMGSSKYYLINSSASANFHGLNDTTFIDTMLNTTDSPYTYKVQFYDTDSGKSKLLGNTIPASSVFLNIIRGYKSMILNWSVKAPWQNSYYIVYRLNKTTSKWDSIGTSNTTSYVDTGLVNGHPYCYYVRSIGSYLAPGFTDPIDNNSETRCSSPRDTVSPCPPVLSGIADCEAKATSLGWTTNDSCNAKVVQYNIYFSTGNSYKFSYIDSVTGINTKNYVDQRKILSYSLAGCYYVTAIDSYSNQSRPSNYVCVDNCPRYILPNVFTPNGDEINDLFIPFPGYQFIQGIDLKIYNRWGQQIFSSSNPAINWDGTDERTHQRLPDGVYYYSCIVKQIRFEGIIDVPLSGTVTIVSKK